MATRSPRTPRAPRPWRLTRAHLARLPSDGNRYEVLDGALLVTPQARLLHQHVAATLSRTFAAYVERHALGIVVGPGAVVWDDNELQPDIQVIPISDRQARAADWETIPLPLLVVEVLSPGSERHDRGKKRDAYLTLGIPEYWIVDTDARSVAVHTPDAAEATVSTGAVTWAPRADLPALSIDLAALLG